MFINTMLGQWTMLLTNLSGTLMFINTMLGQWTMLLTNLRRDFNVYKHNARTVDNVTN